MKAEPQVQEALLELPLIDQKIAQLAAERKTSALKAAATEARASAVLAEERLVECRTAVTDLEREVAKADVDVQTVRTRVQRDQETLDSGSASAKQLTDIQHEMESLARRQAELEDIELEIMERAEAAASELAAAEQELVEAQQRADEAGAEWDRREDEIASETVALEQRRAEVVADLPEDLVALYEKVRERSGVGAGLLRHGQCGACRLMLSSSDLDAVRTAEPDEVVRCDECGAIIVRTAESGL